MSARYTSRARDASRTDAGDSDSRDDSPKYPGPPQIHPLDRSVYRWQRRSTREAIRGYARGRGRPRCLCRSRLRCSGSQARALRQASAPPARRQHPPLAQAQPCSHATADAAGYAADRSPTPSTTSSLSVSVELTTRRTSAPLTSRAISVAADPTRGGESISAAARRLGVPRQTIYSWRAADSVFASALAEARRVSTTHEGWCGVGSRRRAAA
jgi:hypothetical protein